MFKKIFVLRKEPGTNLLVLDGHVSLCSSPELFMLQFAIENDEVILILHSHTAAALQPLDRNILGPFKTFSKQNANLWFSSHQTRKVTRMQVRILTDGACNRPTALGNDVNYFKAIGIFHLDQN